MRGHRIVAIDVGSVRSNFAWAALDLPGRRPVGSGGTNPDEAANAIVVALREGRQVALGFESPIAVPVGELTENGWESLGRARAGETTGGRSRPWSASAGSGALTTGLVQVAWILGRLESLSPGARFTTRDSHWLAGNADVFLWEAFVKRPGQAGISEYRSTCRRRGRSCNDILRSLRGRNAC